MGQPVLEARGLRRAVDGRVLWTGVGLVLREGERVVVRGPSGCGKTLLLRALARLDPGVEGELVLDGRPAAEVPPRRWRSRVTLVPQAPPPWDGTPVSLWRAARSLAVARGRSHGDPVAIAASLHLDPAAWDRPWSLLSGGEQRRVLLAMALAWGPRVLLLDEPLAGLDGAAAHAVRAALAARTAVWVTHDPGLPDDGAVDLGGDAR